MPYPIKPARIRVHAFFDGQNLFHTAKKLFGYQYPNYNPLELAQEITNLVPNRILEGVHFYTGIHDSKKEPFWHAFWTNKCRALGRTGIRIVTRPLKYSEVTIEVSPGNLKTVEKGREKGIDVRIALDLVRMARLGEYDVAIIFSQDTDLEEAVNEVRRIRKEFNKWIFIESAFPGVPGIKTYGLKNTQWRVIDKDTYDRCIDPRDYRPKIST